ENVTKSPWDARKLIRPSDSKHKMLTSRGELIIHIRAGQKTRTFINGQEFVVRAVIGNKESVKNPGFCCESRTFSSILFQKLFQVFMNKTRKSVAIVLLSVMTTNT
ncbi:11051_t:CDS:2, partial [Rhizophagus irregularis]